MSIKLLIFDLDGTLVDTSEDITAALNYAISPLGLSPLGVRDTIGLIGEGITRLIEKALGGEDQHLREEALGRFVDYYSNHLAVHSRPYPYVRATLEKLGDTKKAVLSNKKTNLSERLLKELGLADYFDIIAGSDDASEMKPAAAPIHNLLSRLGLSPADAVIVGDSSFDIEAGKSAGVKTIAVTYGYRPREQLVGADYVIDDIIELVPILTTHSSMLERRRKERYAVPEVFRKYIKMKVRIADEMFQVSLLDFSENGFRMLSPVPFDVGSVRECSVSAPRSLNKEIALKARISHCSEAAGNAQVFIAGAEIITVESELWFRIFKNTLQFITERSGEVF
jgi:phosphoglycolate phosphatase